MKTKKRFYSKVFFYLLVAGLILFWSSLSFGYEWSKTYSESWASSVQQTNDYGYIITGPSISIKFSNMKAFLIKTDASGNKIWSKTFGGGAGHSVDQTTDGGYIISGFTAGSDVYLFKTDVDGTELWSKSFGGADDDGGESVQQTTDGGFIIAGNTKSFGAGSSDVYLIKTDADGTELWSKTFGGPHYEYGSSVDQTTDGGFIIVGTDGGYKLHGPHYVYLIKTDADGNELWSKKYDGVGEAITRSSGTVQQTTDGGYIITGYTSNDFSSNISYVYLLKTDADGKELWSNTFGGVGWSQGRSIDQTTDGGYFIVGITNFSGAGSEDVYLIKTDADGNEQWSKTFGGSETDKGESGQQTTDGGYIVAGGTESIFTHDTYLVYYNPLTCNGEESTILGTAGHDFIKGTSGPDVIHGLGGHDVIYGLGGDDIICGGEGADHLSGNDGNDYISGGKGHDVLMGCSGDDELWGNWGNDTLMGGSGYDVLWGGTGPSGGTQNNNDTCYDALSSFIRGCEVLYERY